MGRGPVIVFFQMEKVTRGLRRIQLERPRHGVNPPAFRAIIAALRSAYGKPDQVCFLPVSPIGGYQQAMQEIWVRGADAISAIYRDTTLQAFEGCVFGITSGPCGLTGQLLVQVKPCRRQCRTLPVRSGATSGRKRPAMTTTEGRCYGFAPRFFGA